MLLAMSRKFLVRNIYFKGSKKSCSWVRSKSWLLQRIAHARIVKLSLWYRLFLVLYYKQIGVLGPWAQQCRNVNLTFPQKIKCRGTNTVKCVSFIIQVSFRSWGHKKWTNPLCKILCFTEFYFTDAPLWWEISGLFVLHVIYALYSMFSVLTTNIKVNH